MTDETWSVILKNHDMVGEKKSKDEGGKDWSAKRVGDQQQVTVLNWIWCIIKNGSSTHSANQSKNYEGQHGTEKGTILRRTSLKTTKAKRRLQSLKWYIEPSRRRGFKEARRQRWHGLSEVAINAKFDSRAGTARLAGAKTILVLCACHPCNWLNWFSNCWSLRPPSLQFSKLILNMLLCAPATSAVKRIDCQIPGLCACHPCSLPEWWLDPCNLIQPSLS